MSNLFLFSVFIYFGCGLSQENLLTMNKWRIESIQNLKLEEQMPEDFDKGTTWDFKKNGTIKIDQRTIFGQDLREENWNLNGKKLIINESKDELYFELVELTKTKLKLKTTFEEGENLIFNFIPDFK